MRIVIDTFWLEILSVLFKESESLGELLRLGTAKLAENDLTRFKLRIQKFQTLFQRIDHTANESLTPLWPAVRLAIWLIS